MVLLSLFQDERSALDLLRTLQDSAMSLETLKVVFIFISKKLELWCNARKLILQIFYYNEVVRCK